MPKFMPSPHKKFEESDLAGISKSECPIACEIDHCVISGEAVCTHPHKGGLHSKHQHDPEILRRFQAARRVIAKQAEPVT